MPTIEIVDRSEKQHRPHWFSLHIDGWDAEYMNNPAQHFDKMLGRLLKEGRNPEAPDTIMDAQTLAIEQSRYVLNRIAKRIASGKLFPGGMPFDPTVKKLTDLLPKGPQKVLATFDQAAAAFLNRGNMQGLTEDQRAARIEERDTKRDHEAEWRKNRAALIVAKQQQLAKLESELAGASSLYQPKLARRIAVLQVEIARMTGSGINAASHGFQYAYGQYLQAGVNFVSGDIRLVPCMTNTTVDTERDAKDQVSDFTTLDEFDGSGYSTCGSALDNQAVNIDDANDRAECDADDETRSSLGAGTRSIDGELVILYSVSLNASMPLHWLEYASDKTPDGSDFVVTVNAEGYLQLA